MTAAGTRMRSLFRHYENTTRSEHAMQASLVQATRNSTELLNSPLKRNWPDWSRRRCSTQNHTGIYKQIPLVVHCKIARTAQVLTRCSRRRKKLRRIHSNRERIRQPTHLYLLNEKSTSDINEIRTSDINEIRTSDKKIRNQTRRKKVLRRSLLQAAVGTVVQLGLLGS